VRGDRDSSTNRRVLPVHNESDRGRKPVLRDELAVVASINANSRKQLYIFSFKRSGSYSLHRNNATLVILEFLRSEGLLSDKRGPAV
jgi:hypothetical protein